MTPPLFNGRRIGNLFEIRWAEVKLPTLVAMLGLKPHGRRLLEQRRVVVAPLFEVAIHRRLG